MKIKIFLSIIFTSYAFAQNAFLGLSTWTDGSTVGYSGGGYLMSFQNSFRNAAMLVGADRSISLNIIKYPADINAQSAIINGKLKNQNFGLAIRNINYGIFESRSSDNIFTGSFSANDTQIDISYARYIYKKKIIIGINSGLFLSQLENTNASLIKISPTVMLKAKDFSTSLIIKNYNKVLDSYTDNDLTLRPSVILSLHKSLDRFPLEIEFSTVSSRSPIKRVTNVSFLYRNSNNVFIRGGTSTNRSDRISGNQFIRNILNDIGLGFGYEMETLSIALNTFSYSNSHLLYGFSISSKF